MENLVNKKVRLRNQLTKTTLVACSDKKSVNHIRLDDNKPKPENSVWIIKSNHPDKSIQLESVYGKFLAWKTSVTGGIAMQANTSRPQDKAVNGVHNWWTFADVDRNGFRCVIIQSSHTLRLCANLYPDSSNTQVMVGLKREFYTTKQLYIWDLEFVEDPIIDLGPGPNPDPVISKPGDKPPVTLPIVEGTIPSTNYTYQVDRMYVYQQGMAGTSFPFPNYANTGRNVNNSGTQIVGGVNIHTHIDNFITWVMENLVNKKVRLTNKMTKSTLIACSDKKSVSHIRLDDNKPKPENSVWIIKSAHPNKSIRLESVYGKLLAWNSSDCQTVIQLDRPLPHDTEEKKGHTWWTFEDVDRSGFTWVRIQSFVITDRPICLHPFYDRSSTQLMVGHKYEFGWWLSWFGQRVYTWNLEIVEDSMTVPGPITSKSEDNPPVTPPIISYFFQVDRMYVYQEGMAGSSFPIPNYANTGHNVNKSGTQIVGGVNVQTRINNLINNKGK